MIVVDNGDGEIRIALSFHEKTCLERDASHPEDWSVKDPASLIKFLLERHIEYCEIRYDLTK